MSNTDQTKEETMSLQRTLAAGEDWCPNPHCFDGKEWDSEETKATLCPVCGGDETVSRGFAKLYQADGWIRLNSPDWDGDDASHSGVTMYSMAMWFRRRKELGPLVKAACGLLVEEPDPEGFWRKQGLTPPPTRAVQLLDDELKPLITFYGFSWGYAGEGPSGLAAMLADAFPFRFQTMDLAAKFVGAIEFEAETWEIRRV